MTTIQARQLLEIIVPLAKGLAFTNDEFMEIIAVCDKALERHMQGDKEDEGN